METCKLENVKSTTLSKELKFKSELDRTSTQTKMSSRLFEKRLDDAMGQVKQGIRESNQKPEE